MRVEGAHVLITGASRGIGAAMARAFSTAGARVSLAARSEEGLAGVAGDTGGAVFRADLLDPAQVDNLVHRVESEAGPIDVLVNNAGLESSRLLHQEDVRDIRDVVRLNLEVPMVLTRAALPGMLSRGTGSLVFLSSLAGTSAYPGMSVYSATKGGINRFAGSLRMELRDTPVNVTVVAAGPVDTEMWDRIEERDNFDPILRRMRILRLLPKKAPQFLAQQTVAGVKSNRRHVRVPRRQLLTYWLGETPSRLTELLLTGVPFEPER